jgi:pyrimidine-nucleoside phosphorylase
MTGKSVVSGLIRYADDAAMGRLVDAARNEELSDRDLAELARGLADSGACLALNGNAADLASTGGPSSLSTLIAPLYLRAFGLVVPKLGVPGRPAGGIDVLQQVAGYRPSLDAGEAERGLQRHGYIHLLADENWAPMDAMLFAYRQRAGAQTEPALVIASILAKKLAAGAFGAGLEIRVAAHGNFGSDVATARRNAQRFGAVARLLELRPVAILTDASRPYQPYLGRGEALVAVAEVLEDRADGWLADHQMLCRRMAEIVAGSIYGASTATIEPVSLRSAHAAVLSAHGSSILAFDDRVEQIRNTPRTIVRADRAGYVEYDLGRLRELLVECQRVRAQDGELMPPDPAGVILRIQPGTEVAPAEPIISLRVPDGEETLAAKLASGVRIRPYGTSAGPAGSSLEII